MIDGTWKGTDGDLNGGFKEGYVGITPFNSSVPQDVQDLANQTIERIKSGELTVYQGPIKDNSGKETVSAGQVLSHNQIMGMDWLVEGVR